MNFLINISNHFFHEFYESMYPRFLKERSEKILTINQNNFNPLFFNHHLKKFDTNLYILFHSKETSDLIKNEIMNEECNEKIFLSVYSLDRIITSYMNVKFHKIVVFHIRSIEYLHKILLISSYFQCELILYISMSQTFNIYFKNKYRSLMKSIHSNEMGYVFEYDEILKLLEDQTKYTISSIQVLKEQYYAFYGSHKNYEIILAPKST